MDKKLVYLGGNIMSHGDNLARQEEYDKLMESQLDLEVYSPVKNKSINDKSSVTEEENNHLAEKITSADIERLWNSDIVVMSPEQNAIGSLCETGCLYGWNYMSKKLLDLYHKEFIETRNKTLACEAVIKELERISQKDDYFHYSDIRTNHLNEKDWRRSFSINQLLYGMILDVAKDKQLNNSFDEVLEKLKEDNK